MSASSMFMVVFVVTAFCGLMSVFGVWLGAALERARTRPAARPGAVSRAAPRAAIPVRHARPS